MYHIEYEDTETAVWTSEQLALEQAKASIPIGGVGWQFVEKFPGKDGPVYCSGEVTEIVESGRKKGMRACEYDDGATDFRSLKKLQELATNKFGVMPEDEEDDYYTDEDDEDVANGDSNGDNAIERETAAEVPTNSTAKPDNLTSGRFFKDLIKLPLEELKSRGTAMDAYTAALADPMKQLEERMGDTLLHNKRVEVHRYAEDPQVDELKGCVRVIEPAYSEDIKSWSQVETKNPLMHEFIQGHVLFHDYLTEITICEEPTCKFCPTKIGRGIRTPETSDGALRAAILSPMPRPVKDPSDKKHFLKPEVTRQYIIDNKLGFEDLKKELPALKGTPDTSAEYLADVAKDKENKKVWKGTMVRDTIACRDCGFSRCIFSEFVKGSSKYGVSKEKQEQRWEKLQQWKDEVGYSCGDVPPVKPYLMRRQLRCRDHVEMQYYSSGNDAICSFCANDEDVLSSEEVKNVQNLEGKEPLPLCKHCVKHKVRAPIKIGGSTNFAEKGKQKRAAKASQHAKAVSRGLRKPTKKRK